MVTKILPLFAFATVMLIAPNTPDSGLEGLQETQATQDIMPAMAIVTNDDKASSNQIYAMGKASAALLAVSLTCYIGYLLGGDSISSFPMLVNASAALCGTTLFWACFSTWIKYAQPVEVRLDGKAPRPLQAAMLLTFIAAWIGCGYFGVNEMLAQCPLTTWMMKVAPLTFVATGTIFALQKQGQRADLIRKSRDKLEELANPPAATGGTA